MKSHTQFTVDEHLQVQRAIEDRARGFWLANGLAVKTELNDWLKAENEVLAEFVRARTQGDAPPASKAKRNKAGGTGSLLPTMRPQHAARLKLEPSSALQNSL